MEDLLFLEEPAGVVHLTLNRPKQRNAFDDHLIAAFIAQLESLAKREDLRLLTLSGSGEHFCAGADVHWMQKMVHYSQQENEKDAKQLAHLLFLLYHFPKPTIAFVRGSVFGGGLGLLSCCDIALLHQHTSFCFSEVKLGIIPAVISPYIVRAIGERAAKYYFLSAELFDSAIAIQLGLGHKLALAEHWEREKLALLDQLLKNGPQALLKMKALLQELYPLPATFSEITTKTIAAIRVSPEGQEGLTAFLEKRKPKWITPC